MENKLQADQDRWLQRLIPLPKEVRVQRSVRLATGPAGAESGQCVGLDVVAPVTPPVKTAISLLSAFATGPRTGCRFVIRLALLGQQPLDDLPASLAERLTTLPNAAEAYAIIPLPEDAGLLLVAATPAGLLHAARTLSQLVVKREAADAATDGGEIEIPLANIVDWPDLPERGQWGGNAVRDLSNTAYWKMNVLEVWAEAGVDAVGRPMVKISHDLFRQGEELAVKVVPYILHLEQVSRYAGLMGRAELLSMPDPSQPLPSDYTPGLCMSSPATQELVAGWLEAAASIPGVTDIMVWLSEGAAPCYCPRCSGKEPFSLEVACITAAFDRIKPAHPAVRLRLLLTQGSYPVNDQVLAATPADVGITYYDGGRTYDSSRKPMIYPLLEEFAASGHWLGVYPQITHCWRTVFPWTAPQFIRYRAQEFVAKKLSCMIGYAVPSNHHHRFNVAAEAEWTWNATGRSAEEFARAYAAVTGTTDPDLFAQWALLAGEAGWTLAESRLLLTVIYNPTLGFGGEIPPDHRFEYAFLEQVSALPDAIAAGRKALALAAEAGVPDMIDESAAVLAGLEFLAELEATIPMLAGPAIDAKAQAALASHLAALDDHAYTLRRHVFAWGERIAARTGEKMHTRLTETAVVLLRTCDALRAAASRVGLPASLAQSGYELQPLAAWSADDFRAGPRAILRINLGDRVPAGGGRYQVGFDFVDSAYGTSIESLRVLVQASVDGTANVVAETPDTLGHDMAIVSSWERWKEFRLDIPTWPTGTSLLLEVGLVGLPTDAPEGRRTCAGRIGLRRLRE